MKRPVWRVVTVFMHTHIYISIHVFSVGECRYRFGG